MRRDSLLSHPGSCPADGVHLSDPYRLGIAVLIQFAAHRQAGFGCGGGNERDDREATDERFSTPSLGDVAEHAMFDLVPLRRPGRVVAHL
jgi:hypothetical protein